MEHPGRTQIIKWFCEYTPWVPSGDSLRREHYLKPNEWFFEYRKRVSKCDQLSLNVHPLTVLPHLNRVDWVDLPQRHAWISHVRLMFLVPARKPSCCIRGQSERHLSFGISCRKPKTQPVRRRMIQGLNFRRWPSPCVCPPASAMMIKQLLAVSTSSPDPTPFQHTRFPQPSDRKARKQVDRSYGPWPWFWPRAPRGLTIPLRRNRLEKRSNSPQIIGSTCLKENERLLHVHESLIYLLGLFARNPPPTASVFGQELLPASINKLPHRCVINTLPQYWKNLRLTA